MITNKKERKYMMRSKNSKLKEIEDDDDLASDDEEDTRSKD
jgi:hypothetical protein